VFIFTELVTTIRVVIARRKVVVEPFLIVGIVAAVRCLIVISPRIKRAEDDQPATGSGE
jgi:uncharacterized membrane protein (DUF373 family)